MSTIISPRAPTHFYIIHYQRMAKKIQNHLHGYHLNSKYWQEWKKGVPDFSLELLEITVGMVLGDASISRQSRNPYVKFEQGVAQKDFLFHLFRVYKNYTFMKTPGIRFVKNKKSLEKPLAKGEIKSYWFKTFSHPSLQTVYSNMYILDGKKAKTIQKEFIHNYLTPRSLAYWIMCDGSLGRDKKTMILHTQGFSLESQHTLCQILEEKLQLLVKVIPHKKKYFVLRFESSQHARIRSYIEPYILFSMNYK